MNIVDLLIAKHFTYKNVFVHPDGVT